MFLSSNRKEVIVVVVVVVVAVVLVLLVVQRLDSEPFYIEMGFGRLCVCFCCGYPCIRKLLMSCPAAKDIWCFPHQVYDAGQKQALDSFKGL